MRVKTKAVLLSVMMLPLPLLATAENNEQQKPVQTSLKLLQIELIQAETVLYEVQVAREKALNELRTLGENITDTDIAGNKGNEDILAIKEPPVSSLPKVKEIYGIHPHLMARITLTSGTAIDVRAGQRIPGTPFQVLQISPDNVVLERNATKQILQP
ncbi:TPA: type IV pilus biogenesis protein PilP [Escherichia coli]